MNITHIPTPRRVLAKVRMAVRRAGIKRALALKLRTDDMRHEGKLAALLVNAKMNLVRVGGDSLHELREDAFDAAHNSIGRVGLHGSNATYAVALMGGEPYAIWN